MIQSYIKPKTIDEALDILAKNDLTYVPIGGGSSVSRMKERDIGVVDLQALGLDAIEKRGNTLIIGATATLEQLYREDGIPPDLKLSINRETGSNLRRQASVAGALISTDGRSPFAAAMVALDAAMTWLPGNVEVHIGDWLPLREPVGKLVVSIRIPLNVNLRVECVARTPRDLPIVIVAVSKWPSGRTRVVLGGFGNAPILALDGPEAGGAEKAVYDALTRASDRWGNADYRQNVAEKLTERILDSFR